MGTEMSSRNEVGTCESEVTSEWLLPSMLIRRMALWTKLPSYSYSSSVASLTFVVRGSHWEFHTSIRRSDAVCGSAESWQVPQVDHCLWYWRENLSYLDEGVIS